jgi:transposase
MNSKQRVKAVRALIISVRERDFPYRHRPDRKIDWTMYDAAQCTETADMLSLIRELVERASERVDARAPPAARGPGRPPTSPSDVAKVLLAQSYLGLSNRVAEGLIHLHRHILGISRTFSYKTIERAYDRGTVIAILDEVITLTNIPLQGLEDCFSIDGSGTPTRIRQNYAHDRERQHNRDGKAATDSDEFPESIHDYVYSIAVVGTRHKVFASVHNSLDHSMGEMRFFPTAVSETKERHPQMKMLCGDGIYANRDACSIVSGAGAIPRFLAKRNTSLKRKGVISYVRMLLDMLKDPQQWLTEYFQREASEAVFSMLKRENPGPLRKRLEPRLLTEEYLRNVVHNVRRLCYLIYLIDLKVLPRIRAAA